MISQAHGEVPPEQPSVIVNISQTEVEAEVSRLPYHPKLPLKRRVSESFIQTRGYLRKQRRLYESGREKGVDCPCLPPPAYNVTMTGPTSKFHSAYSTLPTTPPTPVIRGNESNPRRPSQVTEIIEKVNAKLRRLFGSRRGSEEDERPSLHPNVTQSSSTFDTQSKDLENAPNHRHSEYFPATSVASLPNVREHFDPNGEASPSRLHNTTDWQTFQAKLRVERGDTMQAKSNPGYHNNRDGDLERLHRLQSSSMQTMRCGEQKRKDSQFSLSDFLKPRRFSKAEKGKGRMDYDNETGPTSQDQLLNTHQEATLDAVEPVITDIEALPVVTSDHKPIFASEQPIESGSKIGTTSSRSSASVSPMEHNRPSRPAPTTRRVSVRLVPPTPMPGRGRRSSTASTASSSSVSSLDSPTPMTRPTSALRRLAHDIVSTSGTNDIGAGSTTEHSEPISIPSSYHNSRRSSAVAEGSARPLNDSPTLPPSLPSSTTKLLRHGDRPDTAPSSPSLAPTLVPSLDAMQTLHLGPPQRALLARSVSSGSRIFHVSVEQLPTPTPMPESTQPVSRFSADSFASRHSLDIESANDEPDFSITHPAPPSPLASSPLQAVPSPVKRRTGSLEGSQDLRAVYIEQGKASVITCPPRQRSPRKSLQGRLWWDESPPRVYL
jgi:hypothetical protein